MYLGASVFANRGQKKKGSFFFPGKLFAPPTGGPFQTVYPDLGRGFFHTERPPGKFFGRFGPPPSPPENRAKNLVYRSKRTSPSKFEGSFFQRQVVQRWSFLGRSVWSELGTP